MSTFWQHFQVLQPMLTMLCMDLATRIYVSSLQSKIDGLIIALVFWLLRRKTFTGSTRPLFSLSGKAILILGRLSLSFSKLLQVVASMVSLSLLYSRQVVNKRQWYMTTTSFTGFIHIPHDPAIDADTSRPFYSWAQLLQFFAGE